MHEKILEEMKNSDGAVDKIDDLRKERDDVAGKASHITADSFIFIWGKFLFSVKFTYQVLF